jgi:hypothetical protein
MDIFQIKGQLKKLLFVVILCKSTGYSKVCSHLTFDLFENILILGPFL